MKIAKIEPNILTYRLSMEREDEDYYKCMWAEFILDLDAYRLTINGDAGNYSYCWGASQHETFINLMCRVNEGYLLNKMSDRSRFLITESKQETIKTIEHNGWDCFGIKSEEEWENIRNEILDIDDLSSEEMFFREVDSIVPEIDFECIEIEKDYPPGAKTSIEFFIKYIQPILKELNAVKEGAE